MPTDDFKTEVFQQDSTEVFLSVLKIDHADLDEPIRVVNNSQDITSTIDDGISPETYIAFPFVINLPSNKTGEISQTTLQIDNISRQISLAIRSISGAPEVTLWIIIADNPDVIETGPYVFTFTNITYTAFKVSGSLSYEDILNEPFPKQQFTPNKFPAAF